VSAFEVESDGELSPVPGSPFSAHGTTPVAMVVGPDSDKLYVTNSGSNDMTGFAIFENGALGDVRWRVGTGDRPAAIALSVAWGLYGYLYVANQGSNNVSAYAINPAGFPDQVSGSPFATGSGDPASVIASPAGDRLYVGNGRDTTVSAFNVDRGGRSDPGPRGTLTLLDGSPFDVPGKSVGALAMAPNGRFLYAGGPGPISGFAIDARFPYLSGVRGSPYPTMARGITVASTPPRCGGRRSDMVARGMALFKASPRPDVIVGDAAGNTIHGLGGADLMCGARGRDTLRAGPGNDRILAADGIKDVVDCGPGRDRVRADRRDRIRRCERVLRRRRAAMATKTGGRLKAAIASDSRGRARS
jgi:RTX calcium-binding nonapeptide repeat (4 copies)/Lactonase, 7-bladed beta-propeller